MSSNPDKYSTIVVDASPIFGGAQRSLLTTLSGLGKRGAEIVVVAGSSRLVNELKSRSIPVVPFPFKLWMRNVYGLVNATSDIVQFKGFLAGLGTGDGKTFYANGIQSGLLLSLCLPRSSRLIVHHRDIQCPKFALKKVLKRADANIVLTDFMAGRLVERTGIAMEGRIETVYNAFDFDELTRLSCENSEPELPNDRLLVTFVADLVPWKRHDLFISAIARAVETEPSVYGVIIGGVREPSGERYQRSLAMQVSSMRAESFIEFTGPVANALPLIRTSRAMCALSDDEPFGRTVIEAAASGIPLVVRQPGGPAELAEGLPSVKVVDDDPDSIAESILAAVKEPRYDISDAWKARFSVDMHCDMIFNMLND